MKLVFLVPLSVLAALVVVLLLPVTILLRLWGYYINRLIKSEIGSVGDICKVNDAYFLLDGPEITNNIVILYELQGCPDIKDLKEDVLRKVVLAKDENGCSLFPKATRYITYKRGRPVWMEDPEFDIKDHVFTWEDKPPKTEQGMRDLVGKLISEPLPENKARWQLILVPYTTPDGYSSMIYRWHHSVGDGLATVNLVSRLFGSEHSDTINAASYVYKKQFWKALKAFFQIPFMLVTYSLNSGESNEIQDVKLSTKKQVAWSKGYKLSFLKRMKTVAGVTVNDILMATIAGTLQKYFKDHEYKIPENVICEVAVSIRKPDTKVVLDNQISDIFVSLPTNIIDPVKMLMETKDRIDKLKSSGQHIVSSVVHRIVKSFLPEKIAHHMVDKYYKKFTLGFSGAPPVKTKISYTGKHVRKMIAFGSTFGLDIITTSYCDEITMATMVDNNLQVDPSVFVKGFEETLYQLAEQLGVVEDDL